MGKDIVWKKGDVLETPKGEQYMFGHYDGSGFWVHRITKSGKMDGGSLGKWIILDGVKRATLDLQKRGGWKETPMKTPTTKRKVSAAMPKECPGPNDLPKGLREYEASLSDPGYAAKLLPRLLDLPENGLSSEIDKHKAMLEQVEEARRHLSAKVRRATEFAEKTFSYAVANWTIKELQVATLYYDE